MSTVTFRPFSWELQHGEHKKQHDRIKIWAHTRNSKTILIRIEDYPCIGYVKLPTVIGGKMYTWNENNFQLFYDYLVYRLKDNAPIRREYVERFTLYYYQEVKTPMLRLTFRNTTSLKVCEKMLSYTHNLTHFVKDDHGSYLKNYGVFKTDFYHGEFDTIQKILTRKDCKYANWTRGMNAERIIDDYDEELGYTKESIIDEEYLISWNNIEDIPENECGDWATNPKIIGFDIEAYTNNHRIFPDKWDVDHCAFMISLVFQDENIETRKWGIIYGDCNDIPAEKLECKELNIFRVESEYDMVMMMQKIMLECDPDIITGYNLDFDFGYIDARLKLELEEWPNMSRLKNGRCTVKTSSWEGTTGYTSITRFVCPGRIVIDMFNVVKKSLKLINYKLDTVAKEVLGKGKHPVTPKDMFVGFEKMRDAKFNYTAEFNRIVPTFNFTAEEFNLFNTVMSELFEEIARKLQIYIERNENSNPDVNIWKLDEFQDRIYRATRRALIRYKRDHDTMNGFFHHITEFNDDVIVDMVVARTIMSRIMIYCLIDSDRCIELFNELIVWIGSLEMSNVVRVTIENLYTRGQQIRCLSLIYYHATRHGYVINHRVDPNIQYDGGHVEDPIVGLHLALVLDFKSLYPSIISAFNLCYITLLKNYSPERYRLNPETDIETITITPSDPNKTDIAEDHENSDEEEDHDDVTIRTKTLIKKGYDLHYVKPNVKKGILPMIVAELVGRRTAVRNEQKNFPKDSLRYNVYDQRQLALKSTANSVYGFTGVSLKSGGKLPIMEIAVSITSIGRNLIQETSKKIVDRHGATVVYGDTDSTMVDMHIQREKCHEWGHRLGKEITAELPKPLVLEFENALLILCLKKKKYLARKIDVNGNLIMDPKTGEPLLYIRGIVLARRDNAMWLLITYRHIANMIFDKKSFGDIILHLIECVKTFMGIGCEPVNYEELIIHRGVGAHYKNDNYFMKVFADNLRRIGKPVKPNERIGYMVIEKEGMTRLGDKMVLPEMYLESIGTPNELKPDYLYYINKHFQSSIDQLILAGCRKEIEEDYCHIKYRPNNRCKYTTLHNPLKFIGRMLSNNESLSILEGAILEVMEPTVDIDCFVDGIMR